MSDLISNTSTPYMHGLNQVGYATLVSCIFFIVLSIVAVALRLWTRRIQNNRLGPDDWLIISSVFIFFGFCANILVGVYTAGGGQVYLDPIENRKKWVQYLQSEYAVPPLYALNVTAIKLSILFLYRRIFPVAPFRKINSIVIAICLLWFVAAEIANMLYCIPIHSFWVPSAGSCFNFPVYFLAMELVDILLDVAIIALPIKTILGLQLSWRKKSAILGIFLLGSFVIVTGAVRIGYVYNPGEKWLALAQASLWSVINLGVAILCACLPTYRPVLRKIGSIESTLGSRLIKSRTDSTNTKLDSSTVTNEDSVSSGHYNRTNDGNSSDNVPITNITAKERRNRKLDMVPLNGIHVQRDVQVV